LRIINYELQPPDDPEVCFKKITHTESTHNMAQNTFPLYYEGEKGEEKISIIEFKRPSIRTVKGMTANDKAEQLIAKEFDKNWKDVEDLLKMSPAKQLEALTADPNLEGRLIDFPVAVENYQLSALFRAFRMITKPASVKAEIEDWFTGDDLTIGWDLQDIESIKTAQASFRDRVSARPRAV
jgi:hypothetical protein